MFKFKSLSLSLFSCKYNFSLLVVFLLAFLVPSTFVLGQTVGDGKADFVFTEDPNKNVPELYVHDLILDQAVYSTGDTVSGRFTVSNVKEIDASNVFYNIQLVGNFNSSGFPRTVFDTGEALGPINIKSGEKRTLNFSYDIPSSVSSNDLGIQVQTYLSDGRPAARKAEPFVVTGPVIDYIEHIAQIQVDGEPFSLTDGPTIYRGERIFFAVSLNNDDRTITLKPSVVVYDKFTTGRTIDSFDAKEITINSGETKEQRIELPTFNYAPGIYTAVIEYKDTDGRIRSGPFEARYIISGTEPRIDFVSVDRTSVGANEQFNVFVQFIDSPLDIRLSNFEEGRTSNFDDISAEVTVYDANNTHVDSKKVFFDEGKHSVQVNLTSQRSMRGFYVVTKLYRGEEIIDNVEKVFSDGGELYVDDDSGAGNPGQILIIAAIFFGIVILAIVFVFLAIKKKEKNSQQIGDGSEGIENISDNNLS